MNKHASQFLVSEGRNVEKSLGLPPSARPKGLKAIKRDWKRLSHTQKAKLRRDAAKRDHMITAQQMKGSGELEQS